MAAISSATSYYTFCPPALGKPDASKPKPLGGLDTRAHVKMRGSTDDACWYHVLGFLRDRIKAPNTNELEERRIEKNFSCFRKAIRDHLASLPGIHTRLHERDVKSMLSMIEITNIKLPRIVNALNSVDAKNKSKKTIISITDDFIAEAGTRNLYEYLFHKSLYTKKTIYENLFRELGKDAPAAPASLWKMGDYFVNFLKGFIEKPVEIAQTFYEELIALDPKHFKIMGFPKKLTDLGWHKEIAIIDSLARLQAVKHYKLKISTWHPNQSIEKLVYELKTNGPLSIGGIYGLAHYQVPPHFLDKEIEGRKILGWKKSDPT